MKKLLTIAAVLLLGACGLDEPKSDPNGQPGPDQPVCGTAEAPCPEA